jgi:serine/threonine-protein kinase
MPDELRSRLLAAVGSRYEISDEIGRGGMGVVYRARDVRLRRAVAIKLLPPELAFRDEVRSRFLREAQTAAQLSHPNVVPIYSVDEVDGLVFFVMALVEGDSLGTHLKREGRVSVEFARKVLRDVADALAYAHGRAIVHRDIKPDNILMDRVTGRTLVSDFGIARAAEGDSRLTATGIAVGTPAYMSPEQAIGERDIDGRSDLYSLGVVGYHMLAGELPFSATNTPAMLMKHINQTPRPLRELRPDLPPGLERAIERAMSKQPDQRWPDAAAFRDALIDDSPRAAAARTVAPLAPARDAAPNAAAWPPQPPATHRAIRDLAPPAAYGGSAAPAPPAPPAPPSWLQSQPTADPSRPPIPSWMPESWRGVRQEWWVMNRDQRRMLRKQWREQRRAVARGLILPPGFQPGQELPVEYRIRAFRAHIARIGTTAALLAGINMVTSPVVPWFLIPTAFMSLSVLKRGGALWAEGVRFRDIFGKDARLPANTAHLAGSAPLGTLPRNMAPARAAALVPPDVLNGVHGGKVLRAAEDEAEILEAINRLSKTDREMIPDVKPTVESLVDRVAALAQALHRLDHDVTPDTLARLDERIAAATAEPETSDREKKLTLLRRQRATLDDLLGRRDSLVSQLESASLMLQNIRIDLIALRAAGVQSSIDEASSATQEARALSRDIGHVLEAAKQVRD